MSASRTLLVAMTLLIALGMPAIARAQTSISGTVTLNEQVSLGGSSRMVVQLMETPQGQNEREIDRVISNISGKGPFQFTITTTPLKSTSTYAVVASVADGTTCKYRGRTALSAGQTTGINIQAIRTSCTLPISSSGAGRLLLALVLAGMAGVVALWRLLRQRAFDRSAM